MTSKMKRGLSALLALLLVASPMAASIAESEIMVIEEQTEVAPAFEPEPEPEPEPEAEPEPETAEPESEPGEELVPEEEMETPEEPEDGEPEAPGGEEEEGAQGESSGEPSEEAAPEESAPAEPPVEEEPAYATGLDASSIISPVYVPYGAQEGELPLPASLPASFSDGSIAEVAVVWFCTGNSYDGRGYIPACEDRNAVFYFQATPVGVDCSPSMILPAVAVMYAPEAEAAYDHAAISFAGTDILIAQGAAVTTDDILNEQGYDPDYRIVCEGILEAGESGKALPNPVKLCGAIRGGTFDGEIELARGTIRGGKFNARIDCARGTIAGGAFYGPVGGFEGQIYVTIKGGEFYGGVGDDAEAGCVSVRGGAFYCDVQARNLAVEGEATFYNADGEGGEKRTVTVGEVGVISQGAFYADVKNLNNITGGVFYGSVVNGGAGRSCSVLGGEFRGGFENAAGSRIASYGANRGASFAGNGELRNFGEIDAGAAVRFGEDVTVVNEAGGVIKSGAFPCKVVNYGSILGGNFQGEVVNYGGIYGGVCEGELYNEGGVVAGATLNCMLMTNSGMVTLDGIVVDPEAKTVSVAAGRQVTTDSILDAIGEDAAIYVLRNEGEITGGERALPCDFAPDSTGNISGGSFGGRVYAGEISGGKFDGAVEADSVSDGAFNGRVNVRDNITGGSFGADSLVTAGVIAAGEFSGGVTSVERKKLGLITITGGTFNGSVAAQADDGAVINGGVFNGNVGYRVDAAKDSYDGYVLVRKKDGVAEPKFNGSYVGGRNVVVEWGEFSANTKLVMYTMGSLAGGTFRGSVICNNAIEGGTFYGEVTVNSKPNGQIHGGTFYGRVNNKQNAYIAKDASGNTTARFLSGEIINDGIMDPGPSAEFAEDVQIINTERGRILSGNFKGPVANYGTISGANFFGPVSNYNSISACSFNATSVDETQKTISIARGDSATIEEIQAIEGFDASYTIVNNGTLSGPGTLANAVENRGVISGGTYDGTIKGEGSIRGGTFNGLLSSKGYGYALVIYGGSFNGGVATDGSSAVIYDGTFNCDVGREGDGGVYVYKKDRNTGAEIAGNPVFYGKVAARNIAIDWGTFRGTVILSTVGVLEGGVFYGPVYCYNAITGGEFHGSVTMGNAPNGQIHSGTFYGTVNNKDGCYINKGNGKYSLPKFLSGEIVNDGIIDPGPEAVFSENVRITNTARGRILSGTFRGPVANYGTISGASLYGAVENHSKIVNSVINGEISGEGTVSLEGVRLEGKTITIESGASVSTDQLAGLMQDGQGDYTVVNGGSITAGSASLGCTVKGGTIRGGSFTGPVYAFAIYDGSFSGSVYAKVINGGVYNGSVRDYNERSGGRSGAIPGMEITGGLSINGGTFNGSLGGSGLDDPIFIHGGNFANCQGIKAWNLTIDSKQGGIIFGCPVEFTVGKIEGGTFQDTVVNGNIISGGVFNGKVVNNDIIAAGTFAGGIDNYGVIKALASYNYSVAEHRADGWHVETRTAKLDGTFLNCDVQNFEGGTIESGVTWGAGCGPDGAGATYTAAFIGNTDGTGRVYNGHEFQVGQSVQTSLTGLDAAQSTKSKWSHLDGSAIGASETVSIDPMQNLFLRETSFDIRNGVLELSDGWSTEGGEPNAAFTSVHIPSGATVSAGNWTHPVVNDGAITGGSYVNITNRGTIRGAAINGSITAASGTIENCTFGSGARVASLGAGASIMVSFTVGEQSYSARYGARVLDALNAVRKPEAGYQWYNVTSQRIVASGDTFALTSNSYEIRTMPAPEIIWPTDAAVAINSALSTATFTDRDPNGSFSWAAPGTIVKTAGKQSFEMIFTPDAGNTYSYAQMQTRKPVSVQVSERIITVAVDSYTKRYGEADPVFTGTTTGLKEGESINRTFFRETGNNAGTYEISAKINYVPKGCTAQVIPGTLTIEPKPLNAAVISISEGGKKYYPADRYTKSYTGAAIEPSISVSFMGGQLVEGKDFTCSYRDNLEPGTAYIDITGIGNYCGQASRTFYITAGKATLHIESCSKEFGQPDPEFHATLSGVADPSMVGYELYRKPGEAVGTYSILARKLYGPFDLDISGGGILTITKKQLPSDVTAPEAQVFTGAAIAPKVSVRKGGETLAEGVDYTLKYENNINAGIATAVVTGKGNYEGTARVDFTIEPAPAEIAVESATKNLEENDPVFKAKVTGELGGHKIKYSFDRDPGEELGEYAIRAIPGDNPNYDITVVPGTLTILPVVTRITLVPDKLSLNEGESKALRYEFYPDVATAEVRFSVADSSVATVDPDGTVRAVQAGATSVTATTGNKKSANCQITVLPVAQPLTLANGESKQLSVAKRKVSAYSSSNPSVADVDSKGKLTAQKVGFAEITASANGVELGKWELEVTPAPTKVEISQAEVSLGVGQQFRLSASTDEGSNEIRWSSSKDSVARVDASGMVTAVKAGSATITAESYNGKKATCKITIAKAPASIKLSVTNVKLGAGETMPISVTLSKGSKCEVSYESTNAHIATIRDGMIVTGATGTATITARTYNGKSATCTVTVAPKPTGISLGGDIQMGAKQKLTLPAKLEPNGAYAELSFESSNPKIVAVNDAGLLTAGKSAGDAVITVRAAGLSASINVKVMGAPTGVKISAKKASVGAGQTYQLSGEVLGSDCELEWSSNKTGIATVDQNGLVTTLKNGTVKITAKTYNNKSASCTITVTKAPTSIALNFSSVTLGAGEASDVLKVTLSKKTASEIEYSFGREGIAKLEGDRIVGVAPGSTTLTASTYNGLSATCVITVMDAPSAIDLGEDCSLKVKKSLALEPAFGEGEFGKLSYSTSNKKIATVDANGVVKAKKAGTVVITATAYNNATDSITITVTK